MDHFNDFVLSANQKYNDLQIIAQIGAILILIFSNYSHYIFFIFQKLQFISYVKWFTE